MSEGNCCKPSVIEYTKMAIEVEQLKYKIGRAKEWVKEHTENDGCIDVSSFEVDKLVEILK